MSHYYYLINFAVGLIISKLHISNQSAGKPKVVRITPVRGNTGDTSSEDAGSDSKDIDTANTTNILNSAIRPNTLTPRTAAKLEPGLNRQIGQGQDEDVEMTSGQSTPPETRSPVVFNHQPAGLASVPTLELSKDPAKDDDEDIQSASEASSSDEGSDKSSEDEDEDVEDDEEDEKIDRLGSEEPLQLQHGPQPTMPVGKTIHQKSQLSPSLSDKESTTQDAVDCQLTSSIYEAYTSNSSQNLQSQNKTKTASSRPSSQRPRFKIGASLRDLNAAQGMAEKRRVSTQTAVNGNRTSRPAEDEDNRSESESESGADTDSESDDEGAASKALEEQLLQARSIPLPDSDDDSSSDSESEDEFTENMRNELVADLARMAQKSASQRSSVSKSSQGESVKDKTRIAGRDIVKAEKKKRENKYLTGYAFSQVR
jgi:hypothetical protein